jgi:hypothetical protein
MPGKDSWQQPMPEDVARQVDNWKKELANIESDFRLAAGAKYKSRMTSELTKRKKAIETAMQWESYKLLDKDVSAASYGYIERTLGNNKKISALEELIRWRLWNRTGGGLMAELGSHQLDAAGIFISAMQKEGKKAVPLTVAAMGGRHIFPLDRDCDDHVYCMFEFPGPGFDEARRLDKRLAEGEFEDKIVVTYSSINGNGHGGHGETVIGTKGGVILEAEQEAILFGPASKTSVKVVNKGGEPTLDTTESGAAEQTAGKKALGNESRGYTEEIEHFAWCVRQMQQGSGESEFKNDPYNYGPQPRCHPTVALGDAVIALTTNIAIKTGKKIDFKPQWFDIQSDEVPEDLLGTAGDGVAQAPAVDQRR